jgi:hypothetical protein
VAWWLGALRAREKTEKRTSLKTRHYKWSEKQIPHCVRDDTEFERLEAVVVGVSEDESAGENTRIAPATRPPYSQVDGFTLNYVYMWMGCPKEVCNGFMQRAIIETWKQ